VRPFPRHASAEASSPRPSLDSCSGDMLLESLVACTGVTLKAVATSLDIPLRKGSITAEGDLDFRSVLLLLSGSPSSSGS